MTVSTYVQQAEFTIVDFSLLELLAMPSTLNGEQHPLNQKRVEKLVESMIDSPLYQPLSVTVFNGTYILTGGRHRLDALSQLYCDNLDAKVTCLQFQVETANEVSQQVLTSNGARKMVRVETKALELAAKTGFGSLTVENCIETYVANRDMSMLTMALTLQIEDTCNVTANTALSLTTALMTQLKKLNVTTIEPAKYDTDGTPLTTASKGKCKFLETLKTTDDVENLVTSLPNGIVYIANTIQDVAVSLYLKAKELNVGFVDEAIIEGSTVKTLIKLGNAPQGNAVKYVRVAMPSIKGYISEVLEVTLS